VKTTSKIFVSLLFLVNPVFAQFPRSAAVLPKFKLSAGYENISLSMSSAGRVNLKGFDADLTRDFGYRLGVTASIGYARSANTFGSGRHYDALTYLVGPVFYPTQSRTMKSYLRVLVGGAGISGPVPLNTNGSWGYVNKPSLAVGGGIEYRTLEHIYLRSGADYLRTNFFAPSLKVTPQNNFRLLVGVVYVFGLGGQRRK
jgi:opacity protein-like surface antigen